MGKKLLIVNTYANLWSTAGCGRGRGDCGKTWLAVLFCIRKRIEPCSCERLELIKALYRILYIPICFPVFSI